jgi:WhiB family transcriptional regulator, redox-sensing transcriptional regulator
MTNATDWRAEAACAEVVRPGYDPFFADTKADIAAALAICQLCRVRGECLAYAIQTQQRWGVWGGHPQRQLRQLIDQAQAGRPRRGQPRHRNAVKTHCRRGHPFTRANTYYSPDGRRYCRACNRIAQRRRSRERGRSA